MDQEVCPGACCRTHSGHDGGRGVTAWEGTLISSRIIDFSLIVRMARIEIILFDSVMM